MVDTRADHLLFLVFDLENLKGEVVYSGVEEPVIKLLPTEWVGQKTVSMMRIRRANSMVAEAQRLGRHSQRTITPRNINSAGVKKRSAFGHDVRGRTS